MIARALRLLKLKRQLDRKLRARRIIRRARAEAARQGISNHWRKAGERTRTLFNTGA